MYGKTGKSAHYLPRTGSYSTVPKRNGHVAVLPVSAKEPLFADLKGRKARLSIDLADARKNLQAAKRARRELEPAFQEWSIYSQRAKQAGKALTRPLSLSNAIEAVEDAGRKVAAIESEISKINRVANPKRFKHLAWAEIFVDVARLMLDEAAFERIKAETQKRALIAEGHEGAANTTPSSAAAPPES